MYAKFLIWLFKKALMGKNPEKFESFVKGTYLEIAKDNLKIKSEIVRVKKGKKRFDLLFFETPQGKLKFDLGRHWENKTDFVFTS